MTVNRSGKCFICETPCRESKKFKHTLDIFDPVANARLEGQLADEIKAWRDSPMYCREHTHHQLTESRA